MKLTIQGEEPVYFFFQRLVRPAFRGLSKMHKRLDIAVHAAARAARATGRLFLSAIAGLAIAGCGGGETILAEPMTVTITLVDDVRAACGWSALEPHGCAKVHGTRCEIIAKRPRSFDDSERIKTLGHELWHCYAGPKHL